MEQCDRRKPKIITDSVDRLVGYLFLTQLVDHHVGIDVNHVGEKCAAENATDSGHHTLIMSDTVESVAVSSFTITHWSFGRNVGFWIQR